MTKKQIGGALLLVAIIAGPIYWAFNRQESLAMAATENCEEYYQEAIRLVKVGPSTTVLPSANGSIAYSLIYLNCVARQNKR